MSPAATWLPPELTVVQPYSMGPVTNWSPIYPLGQTLPAYGTILQADDAITTGARTGKRLPNGAEMAILGMWVAPTAVQRAAQAAGERGIIWIRAKGLLEALGGGQPHGGVGADTVAGRRAQRVHAETMRETVENDEALPALLDLLRDDGEEDE